MAKKSKQQPAQAGERETPVEVTAGPVQPVEDARAVVDLEVTPGTATGVAPVELSSENAGQEIETTIVPPDGEPPAPAFDGPVAMNSEVPAEADAPDVTFDPGLITADGEVGAPRGPSPEQLAHMATTAPKIRLERDGVELVWEDKSEGHFGFIVETSHDRNAWRDEVELPADTTRYKPVRVPPSNTDFYRVSYKVGDARAGQSNEVVIHFN